MEKRRTENWIEKPSQIQYMRMPGPCLDFMFIWFLQIWFKFRERDNYFIHFKQTCDEIYFADLE